MRETATRLRPLSTLARDELFGGFLYRRDPLRGPEAITILGGWDRQNIVRVHLPILGGVNTHFHKLVAPHALALVEAWREAGVLEDVLTYNGGYAARLVRGTKLGTLSAHAWGSAFDINAAYNRLGKTPAALGEKGSVLRLVPIAEALGWYWGGRFTRHDGMHFELARL